MSDSSSDDDEFAVLSIIGGKDYVANPPKKRKLRASITAAPMDALFAKPESAEFELKLPSIFRTDAKKNEVLAENDKKIKEDMARHEMEVKKEYERIQTKKQLLLNELNDNGTEIIKYSLDNDEDKKLIEKLVRDSHKRKDGFALTRHFYFYSNVYKPTHNLNCSLPFKINEFLFNEGHEKIFKILRAHFHQFINYCLVNIFNINQLYQIIQFIQTVPPLDITISSEQFLDYIKILGGNVSLVSSGELPIKLGKFNNHVQINILRLTILFNFVILVNRSEEVYYLLIKAFILTLSDFNFNKKGPADLRLFMSTVFKNLINWRLKHLQGTIYEKHDLIVIELNDLLKKSLVTCIYNEGICQNEKINYELRYNVLRLLNTSFEDKFIMRIITSLNISFFSGTDYLLNKNHDLLYKLTPPISFLRPVLEKIGETDALESLKSNDPTVINHVFYNYYKLLTLNFIITKTFKDNINTSQKKLEYDSIKKSNYVRLKELSTIIYAVKLKFYRQLQDIGFLDFQESELYHKEEVVKYITDCYYVLNCLNIRLDKDINLINEDIFYSEIGGQ